MASVSCEIKDDLFTLLASDLFARKNINAFNEEFTKQTVGCTNIIVLLYYENISLI